MILFVLYLINMENTVYIIGCSWYPGLYFQYGKHKLKSPLEKVWKKRNAEFQVPLEHSDDWYQWLDKNIEWDLLRAWICIQLFVYSFILLQFKNGVSERKRNTPRSK